MTTTPQQMHMKEDLGGIPVPQSWDPLIGDFEETRGHGGASSVMKARWWQIGAGATTTSIPLLSLSGLAISLSTSTQSQWVGSRFGIELSVSGTNTACEAVVTSVSASGTLTLDSALPATPASGAKCYLVPPEETQLVGRNVTEVSFFNALAITDTLTHNSSNPPYTDVSMYGGRKMLIVYNTLDQSVSVRLLTSPKGGTGALECTQNVTVASGKSVTITAADIRELGEPINRMGVRLICSVAPTTGSVSAWMEGDTV